MHYTKLEKIDIYICPTCGKQIDTFMEIKIDSTAFKDAKVIDFSKLSLEDFTKYYNLICETIMSNIGFKDNVMSLEETTNQLLNFIINVEKDKKILKH